METCGISRGGTDANNTRQKTRTCKCCTIVVIDENGGRILHEKIPVEYSFAGRLLKFQRRTNSPSNPQQRGSDMLQGGVKHGFLLTIMIRFEKGPQHHGMCGCMVKPRRSKEKKSSYSKHRGIVDARGVKKGDKAR